MSISKKIYLILIITFLLISLELLALVFSMKTLSAIRTYVGGESSWSKAQKDAIYNLNRYVRTKDEKYFKAFNEKLQICNGDRIAFMELEKGLKSGNTDFKLVRKGWEQGDLHPEDINNSIFLYTTFRNRNKFIDEIIDLWYQGDYIVKSTETKGNDIHQLIINKQELEIENIQLEIENLNEKLTKIEIKFSKTLGECSRWLENLIFKILISLAATVELTGVILTITLSYRINKGIKQIIEVATFVNNNDYSKRIKLTHNDELTFLSLTFNKMIEQIEYEIGEKNRKLLESNQKLVKSNAELENFALIAAHDLQDPLKKINVFIKFVKKGKLEFIENIEKNNIRMQDFIKNLLLFAKNNEINIKLVSIKDLIDNVLNSLIDIIDKNTKIIIGDMPTIQCDPIQIERVFQNLIKNAINYQSKERSLKIEINSNKLNNFWMFSVKDNGIGISESKIPTLFVVYRGKKIDSTGAGFGLSICKRIVEMHGGKIIVESKEEEGSIFNFTIDDNLTKGQ